MKKSAILCGIGAWLPPKVVTNDDLSEQLETSDEWIRTRTGIRQRHIVDPGMSTGDLAVEAGRRALKSAGGEPVDLVILATATPDHPCPATAPAVAHRLGLIDVAAWDLSAVCSGFLYGLAAARGFIAAGTANRVLLIGADTFSTILAPGDRTTRPIFGDGAGAVVLRAGEPDELGALGPSSLGSDGSLRELITVPAGGSRFPVNPQKHSHPDPGRYFTMQGKTVFRHAVARMAGAATEVRRQAGWSASDVDCFVAHQANYRILQAVVEKLGIPMERCAVNLAHVGNTAAASIPLALADAAASGLLRPGHRALLAAFGGGATWGAAALTWPDLTPERT
ncbi:beta-ketoacyl-ACP synthase III [Streptomyces kanamyceticus]|uniref:Beta-ketoacyl-[acyl-carrier-protein] synthase III n=1 Tax=Streptomyces kanamyceticus TaxID=1967 RepID=A0A5J6G638_STRKN|nr:beta-ketoacyl-ACP synthase III [Streptomyces kanamyceticus]QEU90192.1 ketoacyl-ACP synthase III [Streptomyces kanamyceticus]